MFARYAEQAQDLKKQAIAAGKSEPEAERIAEEYFQDQINDAHKFARAFHDPLEFIAKWLDR
jgi:hypothetical protein